MDLKNIPKIHSRSCATVKCNLQNIDKLYIDSYIYKFIELL